MRVLPADLSGFTLSCLSMRQASPRRMAMNKSTRSAGRNSVRVYEPPPFRRVDLARLQRAPDLARRRRRRQNRLAAGPSDARPGRLSAGASADLPPPRTSHMRPGADEVEARSGDRQTRRAPRPMVGRAVGPAIARSGAARGGGAAAWRQRCHDEAAAPTARRLTPRWGPGFSGKLRIPSKTEPKALRSSVDRRFAGENSHA